MELEDCCTSSCLHDGSVWGFRLFKVKACCNCEDVMAEWSGYFDPLFDVLCFLSWMMGHEQFAIQLKKKPNHKIK